MTFHVGMFEGDSHAGWRRTSELPKDWWPCSCPDEVGEDGYFVSGINPPHRVNCPECFDRRPGS